ncbi:MAG: hypothetical protein ACRDE7_04600, partial [Sphingobacterium sp.]
ILYITLLLFCSSLVLGQRRLTVTGANWNVNPPAITDAGANYSGTYQSPSDQILLSAQVPLLLASGKVSVRYEGNPTWHNALKIAIRRTGQGSTICLLCGINGGLTYQPITTVDTDFFTISAVLALASYSNIPVQLSLSGVSVTIPAANYQSRIVFTIGPI